MQIHSADNWESANLFASHIISTYWPFIITGVSGWFSIAYLFHTRMIRSMANSHPVTRKDEPALYNLVENLCISQGMSMPRLEIIESHARNAFASGIHEKSFCVTVTRGLLQSLSKDEVEGVLAHELTHIQNRDVRLLIITIIFTGMLGFAAQVMWRNVRYGVRIPRRHSKNNGGGLMLLMALLCVLWIGYFATLFTRFALSRRREYMADAGAVQMTKNPDAMMRALMRIAGRDQIPKIPGDITMMCVENRKPFMGFFATHPPIGERIKALSETTNSPIPDLPQLTPFSAPAAPKKEQFSPWDHNRTNWTTRERFKRRRAANPWAKNKSK
jgi:heat shock protein HtpX